MSMANIRFPFWQPEVGAEESAGVARVFESNYLNDGAVTAEFESRIAQMFGAKHAVAVTSGTAALFVSLVAAGVGYGDEVIVPDITFIATANAVSMTGARAVLADVDATTLTLCPHAVDRALTPRTKAIIPVHLSGRAANLNAIVSIAKQHRLRVIEDGAEAWLSRFEDGRYLGTIGDAGALSLSPNKTITTGQGGIVLTNDEYLFARIREIKDQGRPARGTGGDDVHMSLGYNFKFTNLQAAVGLAQLDRLPARTARLRAMYQQYKEELAGVEGISLLPFTQGEIPQWIDCICDNRDALNVHLLSRGMQGRKFWYPLHTQAPYRSSEAKFIYSSRIGPTAFWLPSAFQLTERDVSEVCGVIRKFYSQGAVLAEAA